MKHNLSIAITVLLFIALGVFAYLEATYNTSTTYLISPGNLSTDSLACPILLGGENAVLINASNMAIYNVSGYSDYVINTNTKGLIWFNVSNEEPFDLWNRTLNITNYLTLYHEENATLINYSDGSGFQSCDTYVNGTTYCIGTLPSACYLGDVGEIICQKQYDACYGSGAAIGTNISTAYASFNYTCNKSYLPPESTMLELETHTGVNFNISPLEETLTYNTSKTGLLYISVSGSATDGTYLASLNSGLCGQSNFFLLTIGSSPYAGAVPQIALPLATLG